MLPPALAVKAKTFLASTAGYQPGGKRSIVDWAPDRVCCRRASDRSLIPALETANLAEREATASTSLASR